MKMLFVYVIAPILAITLICAGSHWFLDAPWSLMRNILTFVAPLAGVLGAYLALAATHKQQAIIVDGIEKRSIHPLRKDGQLQIATPDLKGKWQGNYSWEDLETGNFYPATEEIVIDFFDRQTGDIRGTASDRISVAGPILPTGSGSKGQLSEICGKVFRDRLLFCFTSKQPDRDSYGCAVLEFDNSTPTSLQGLVIFNDVKRGRLFTSRYVLQRTD